jgi:hypothetical protein
MKMPDDVREFFRKTGSVGGKARRDSLSPEQRRRIAKKAARARWAKSQAEKPEGKK